ncbi:MAG: hypothetical protein WBH03_16755 [Cyclobacteriaceae bacterium]
MCLASLLLVISSAPGYAQSGRSPVKNSGDGMRTMAVPGDTLDLPFFDDFSDTRYAPDPVRWPVNRGVLVGNDLGVNVPTLGAATFDGVDITGRPYNINSAVASGLADTLVSAPLDLTQVVESNRSTVYLLFYVQYEGLGENPDETDSLYVSFYNESGEYETVWSSNSLGAVSSEEFIPITVPVNMDRWYHSGFRMQFASTGRLSGGFDTWQIDYVFLGPGRSQGDMAFEDRALATYPNTIFGDYYAIPVEQFVADPQAYIQSSPPSALIRNLDDTDQPIRIAASLQDASNGETIQTINTGVEGDAQTVFAGQTNEFFSNDIDYDLILDRLDADRDGEPDEDSLSLELDLVFSINSGDSVLYSLADPDSAIVDFAVNDTARTRLVLDNYFAYDDGTAEFGLSVKGRSARFAYQFILQTPAILEGVQIAFPNLGRLQSGTLIDIIAWDNLSEDFGDYLALAERSIQGTDSVNKFVYYQFNGPIVVEDTLYVGWQQNTDQPVVVGLDRSGDTSDRMFLNLGSEWVPVNDPEIVGNLLIRPVFRTAVVSGLPEIPYAGELPYTYPNPASERIVMGGSWESLRLYGPTGQHILDMDKRLDGDMMETANLPNGMYLFLFYDRNGTVHNHKMIVNH